MRRVIQPGRRWWSSWARPWAWYAMPLGLGVALLAGCESGSFLRQSYVSPRVIGRVVDAETSQPVAGAEVRRAETDPSMPRGADVHGAQRLIEPPPALTDADGRFTLTSVKAMTFLQHSTVPAAPIEVRHPHYLTLVTNLPASRMVVTEAGPPVLQAGDLPLHPRP